MNDLRLLAHIRHQVWSQMCWWWWPQMRVMSGVMHAMIVDEFFDALEGRTRLY